MAMSRAIQWKTSANPPSERAGLHNQVATRIGTLITQGRLHEGDVLPNEAVLGAEFGVSRTALREAIKVLASKGLVEVRRKTGTRVRPRAAWNMLDPELLGWLFAGSIAPDGLSELMELRRMIEPSAARLASERASNQDLQRIDAAFRKMEEVANDVAASVEADLSFHLALLDAAQNDFLRSFGALIQSALRASFRLTNSNHALYLRSLKLHGDVVKAVLARRGNAAEKAMLVMLTQTSEDIAAQSQGIRVKSKARQVKKHLSDRRR